MEIKNISNLDNNTNDFNISNNKYRNKLKELFNLYKNDLANLEYIDRALMVFVGYFNIVFNSQKEIELESTNINNIYEYLSNIKKIENKRTKFHDLSIEYLEGINLMLKNKNLKAFTDIDINNRVLVSDFIGKFVLEIYEDCEVSNLDEAIQKAKKPPYDYREIKGILESKNKENNKSEIFNKDR